MISSPKCVVDAIAALSQDKKNKIKELGFGELLKFSLDVFGDRYMLEFLMDHTDPENMEIRVGGGDKNLPINEHVVQPSGSKKMVFAPLLLILCRFVC
jgi:hypothetical protein